MAEGGDFTEPTVEYRDDKKDPENYVQICVDIPGIKKKFIGSEASNAEVSLTFDNERSFTLVVVLDKGKGKKENYKYTVKQLPGEISTDTKKSTAKVKSNEVVLMLHKVKAGSWAGPLSRVGLEHHGQ